jgi:hypothetical protein
MKYNKKILKVKKVNGPKVRDKKGVQQSFAYLLKLVEDGWTISEATELGGVDRTALYKHITTEQKCLLTHARTTHTKYGMIAQMSTPKKEKKAALATEEDEGFKDLILERLGFYLIWEE